MYLRQSLIPGLGHISAILADEASGTAAVVDPRRDVDIYLDEARARGLSISHVFETHLHNDYVSGAAELAAVTGAVHVIGSAAGLATPHLGVVDGSTIDAGALRFSAIETPGHTPEHVSYAVTDLGRADDPELLFTGGSLLVGSVGRTDLLGAEHARPYARAMFASLHDKLLHQHDHVGVLPTHGAGSLCSRSISAAPSSTIGQERRDDPLLRIADVEAFADALLAGQPAYPAYFARMRSINQAGPRPIGAIPGRRPLPAARAQELLAGEHLLVDVRRGREFAAAHVPGALSIPMDDSFGTWLGWVVDFDRPLVLLLRRPEDWNAALRQALRIGFEHVTGHLEGGVEAWRDAGLPLESAGRIDIAGLHGLLAARGGGGGGGATPLLIDVRQADEFASGHVPGSLHLMAGDLPQRLAELPRDREIVTICASGFRSSIAASLLQRAGFDHVTSVSGGVPGWQAAGYPVEMGA
ncbi:MAG: MBL fold metallo-hydrolase [Candidatus Limnocylindrales bacterium]